MPDRVEEELIAVAHAWDRALVENDADTIGQFMGDEWMIVGSDGSLGDRASFLDLVRSGVLCHDVMTSEDVQVRVYGDVAVLIARGVSGGMYQGRAFLEAERTSNVFVKQDERWQCVLTHLSRIGGS